MGKKSARRIKKEQPPKGSGRSVKIVAAALASIAAVAGLALLSAVMLRGGGDGAVSPPVAAAVSRQAEGPRVAQQLSYEVVKSYPHDPQAFLQGLVWAGGKLYESTGLNGRSSLRLVKLKTGKVKKKVNLDSTLFGEGLTAFGDRLIQLTWTSRRGFVYDRSSFRLLREFSYQTEGWGITHDGANLIMSDGSNTITYLDPETFAPVRQIQVTMNGRPLNQLNELEFIEGEIWANVWQTDMIVRIDPATGEVVSFLDLEAILTPEQRTGGEDVLNGIAYDAENKRIFVSGKLWPRLFQIKVR